MTLTSHPLSTLTLDRVRIGDGANGLIVALPVGEVVTVIHRCGERMEVRWKGQALVLR